MSDALPWSQGKARESVRIKDSFSKGYAILCAGFFNVLGVKVFLINQISKKTDRTTIDLFEDIRRPGRPKTNPYPRELQLKHNKRNQLKRDKANGLKRIEFKVSGMLYETLNAVARRESISRGELIEKILNDAIATAEV